MSVIHYKLKSAGNKWESLSFDKQVISVLDLKRAIVKAKHLSNNNSDLRQSFDLLIKNAQTGEDYGEEGYLIPKNSSVIVQRVPAERARSLLLRLNDGKKEDGPNETPTVYKGDDFGDAVFAAKSKETSDVEKQMMAAMDSSSSDQSAMQNSMSTMIPGQQPAGYVRPNIKPYKGYVCNSCGSTDHYIKHCPAQNASDGRVKRMPIKPAGIPRDFLQVVEDPKNVKGGRGALDMGDGHYALHAPNENAFLAAYKPPTLNSTVSQEHKPTKSIDLLCSLCQDYYKECVLVPCCFTSYCDACIRQSLLTQMKCPTCDDDTISVNNLRPNKKLRQKIATLAGVSGSSSSSFTTTITKPSVIAHNNNNDLDVKHTITKPIQVITSRSNTGRNSESNKRSYSDSNGRHKREDNVRHRSDRRHHDRSPSPRRHRRDREYRK